jgi:hypothetical protein
LLGVVWQLGVGGLGREGGGGSKVSSDLGRLASLMEVEEEVRGETMWEERTPEKRGIEI